eukprot:3902833-Pleurochrysis_carterae.AAC.1
MGMDSTDNNAKFIMSTRQFSYVRTASRNEKISARSTTLSEPLISNADPFRGQSDACKNLSKLQDSILPFKSASDPASLVRRLPSPLALERPQDREQLCLRCRECGELRLHRDQTRGHVCLRNGRLYGLIAGRVHSRVHRLVPDKAHARAPCR